MQEFGLQLLERQDNLLRAEQQLRDDRRAMLASPMFDPEKVFPEWFAKETTLSDWDEDTPEDILDQDDTDYDYSDVTWQSPQDLEEDELALLRQMMAENEHVEVGSD